LVIWKANCTPPVRQVVETARWFPSVRGNTHPRMHAQFTGCERTARGVPILHQNRADAATSCAWYGVGMWKREKRAAVANVATKAPAAGLGWGGCTTGGLGGTARTPRGALRSAVEIAPAPARRLSVPQCSAGHVRPAAGEMGARCSRVFGTAAAAEYSSSAFHRAARHLQRAHCARPLARCNKAPDARSEAAAHCGNQGTGVPRARSSPRVTAALLVRRRQAHRGSGAPLLFATTGRVPRSQFRAHQWPRNNNAPSERVRTGRAWELPRSVLDSSISSQPLFTFCAFAAISSISFFSFALSFSSCFTALRVLHRDEAH